MEALAAAGWWEWVVAIASPLGLIGALRSALGRDELKALLRASLEDAVQRLGAKRVNAEYANLLAQLEAGWFDDAAAEAEGGGADAEGGGQRGDEARRSVKEEEEGSGGRRAVRMQQQQTDEGRRQERGGRA